MILNKKLNRLVNEPRRLMEKYILSGNCELCITIYNPESIEDLVEKKVANVNHLLMMILNKKLNRLVNEPQRLMENIFKSNYYKFDLKLILIWR